MPEPTLREFMVPDLGEGLEDATIVEWTVAVGDAVALNQVVCSVETAKAEVDIPSPHSGVVVELGGDAGQTLPVGDLLIRFDVSSSAGVPSAGAGQAAPVDADSPKPQPTLVGYGHDESLDRSRRDRRDATASAPVASAPDPVRHPHDKPLAKPPVRLLARRLGVDLNDLVPGSGPQGIITRQDVERSASRQEPGPAAAIGLVEEVPVRGVRARIAEHMTRSRHEIPDASCSVVVDCSRLLDTRRLLNDHCQQIGLEPIVTPFSLLCRFVVQALGDNGALNATFDGDGPVIRLHRAVHLGIGTATDRGLVVTVIKDAHVLAVHPLSEQMAQLTDGARHGTLGPADMQGSTFTVSNFGALGLDDGTPIINHPEAAILGVGSIRPRPHVVDGQVLARPTATLTLAFDHRVCDGAEAGAFLRELRRLIETPETSLLR